MKDNLQNISDLIGALAEDIEEIKKILATKDASDKDEAVKRLAVKLEPVIRFFGGSTPENINGIFGSKEAIEDYKKSLPTMWRKTSGFRKRYSKVKALGRNFGRQSDRTE